MNRNRTRPKTPVERYQFPLFVGRSQSGGKVSVLHEGESTKCAADCSMQVRWEGRASDAGSFTCDTENSLKNKLSPGNS